MKDFYKNDLINFDDMLDLGSNITGDKVAVNVVVIKS